MEIYYKSYISEERFLVPILSPLTTNDFTLENSYAFVNALTESNLSSKCFMASYDVSNLFTNIPLDETITIILNSLFSNHDSLFLGMTRELFKTFFRIFCKILVFHF